MPAYGKYKSLGTLSHDSVLCCPNGGFLDGILEQRTALETPMMLSDVQFCAPVFSVAQFRLLLFHMGKNTTDRRSAILTALHGD